MEKSIEWILEEYLASKSLSGASVSTYRTVVHTFIKDTKARIPSEVSKATILEWRQMVLARATPQTWNNYLRHMRAIFNYAVSQGYLAHSPFLEVSLVRTPKKRKKGMDHDAIQYYFHAMEAVPEGWFWQIVTRTFYYTGMRRRQLVGLRWPDVDLDRRILLLRSETSKNLREWHIPICDNLAPWLSELRKRTLTVTAPNYLSHGQVFNIALFNKAYRTREMTAEQVTSFYLRLRRNNGNKYPISPHRFRHNLATQLVREAPVRHVQELLGHTSLSTTMEYVEPDIEDLRKAVSKMPSV